MKHTLLIIILLSTVLISCKEDEEPIACSQAAWIGTYTGTSDCVGDNTIEIEAGRTENEILVDGEFTEIDGCSGSYNNIFFGNGQSVDITLDGNSITMIRTTAILGVEVPCTTEASK